MIKNFLKCSMIFGIFIVTSQSLIGQVDSITGDTGSAQSGPLTISGGSSGAVFDTTTTSTITQSFNYISLPITSSTNGQIIIGTIPMLHAYGPNIDNIYVGPYAGNFTDNTGAQNTGVGTAALGSVAGAAGNVAVGQAALTSCTTSVQNTVIGQHAGQNLLTGSFNILLGVSAGTFYIGNESNNIMIGHQGLTGESNVTRIGGGGQSSCYIDGIYNGTPEPSTATTVYVDNSGLLGTIPSSDKYKENVQDISNESAAILNLKVVKYHFKTDKSKTIQYGLIAEEVHKIFPDLVIKDKKTGMPNSVRYHELPVLILKELQKAIERIAKLEAHIAKLEARLAKLEALIGK